MKLTPTNKEIEPGLITKVFDPQTKKALANDAVIELDELPFEVQQYYQRVLADGDLKEFIEPAVVKKSDKIKD